MAKLIIRPVETKKDRKIFIDLPFRLYADDPNWVPPLKSEALGLITPEKNGWFSHAKAQLFLAEEDGRVVGRISAHIDTLALTLPPEQGFGPGVGCWGLLEAEDRDLAHTLIATAEDWLRGKGMTVNAVADPAEFRHAVLPMYESFRGAIGAEIVQQALAASR